MKGNELNFNKTCFIIFPGSAGVEASCNYDSKTDIFTFPLGTYIEDRFLIRFHNKNYITSNTTVLEDRIEVTGTPFG